MNTKITKLLEKIRKKSSIIGQEIYEIEYALRTGKIDLEHRITNKDDHSRLACSYSIDEQKDDLKSYEAELEILRKLEELSEVNL